MMLAVAAAITLHIACHAQAAQHVVLQPGLNLTWAVRGPFVHFTASLEPPATPGWIAVGVSATGEMVDTPASNAVIYKPEDGTVEQYVINNVTSAAILPAPTPATCLNFSASSVGGEPVTMSWTRAFDNGNASQAQLQASGATHIIFATGASMTWGDNPNYMGAVEVTLVPPPAPAPPQSVILAPNVTLGWAVVEVDSVPRVAFSMVAQAVAWIAVGVSDDGSMSGALLHANAFICFPQNASATGQYEIDGYTAANFTATPTPATTGNVTCSNNATHTTLSFTRAFNNGLPKQAQLNTTGPTNVIFAVGTDPTFADGPDFTRMGSAVVNFTSAPPPSPPPPPPPPPAPAPPPPPPPPPPPSPPSPPGPPSPAPTARTVTLAPGYNLTYNLRADSTWVDFQARYEGSAWIAVGISSNGDMVNADRATTAVIFKPTENTVQPYELGAYNIAGIVPLVSQDGYANLSGAVVDGITTMWWSRKLDTLNASQAQMAAMGPVHIVFAAGDTLPWSDKVAYMRATTIDFAPANAVQFDSKFSMSWSYNSVTGDLTIAAVMKGTCWASIGITATAGSMVSNLPVGSNAFMFHVKGAMLLEEYVLTAHSLSGVVPAKGPSALTNKMFSQANGYTNFSFTRKLAATTDQELPFNPNGFTHIIWAYGPEGNAFTQHVANGAVEVNFLSGAQQSSGVSLVRVIHGSLMFLSIGLMMPIGIMAARFFKEIDPTTTAKGPASWFLYHRAIQVVAWCLAVVGFSLAVYFVAQNNETHFSSLHSRIALPAFILAAINPFVAVIRPLKSHPMRPTWEFVHKGAGYVAVLLAVPAIVFGLRQIEAPKELVFLYSGVAGLLLLIFLGLQYKTTADRKLYADLTPLMAGN